MKSLLVLALPLLVITAAFAQSEEGITPYAEDEVENYLNTFRKIYKDRAQPEEDAVSLIENLVKAYRYLGTAPETIKSPEKLQEKIVKVIAQGLKARNRPLVNMECAKALGEMGSEEGVRPLVQWMDGVVLDAKSPHPQWVEYGFAALAKIGSDDRGSMDLLESYGTGKHMEITVASHAITAIGNWKFLSGKDRKELFEKVHGYLSGLWSSWKGGDPKKRAEFERRYKAVEDSGLKTLTLLAGVEEQFADPTVVQEWWNEHKRDRWEDYVPPELRKKEEAEKPAEGEEEPEEGGDS